LDLVVVHDLDPVAPRTEEVETATGQDLDALAVERLAHRTRVVDDQPDGSRETAGAPTASTA
jgi:hypothetical protein